MIKYRSLRNSWYQFCSTTKTLVYLCPLPSIRQVIIYQFKRVSINPFQDGLFRGCSQMRGAFLLPLPKIRHANPTMMKLGTVRPYLRNIQKMYKSRGARLGFYWHQIGFPYIISIFFFFFNFLESLVIVLIHMVIILMMSAKWLWPHNFCLWRHQQNFITWFEWYYSCGHVTKVW